MIVRMVIGLLVAAVSVFANQKFQTSPVTGSGEAMVSVSVPDLNAIETAGSKSFIQNCAACHGENAAGKRGFGPPLIHKIYEPSHHGDMAFVLAAKQGVRAHHWKFGNMPAVPNIKDAEIAEIIAYIRKVQRANDIN